MRLVAALLAAAATAAGAADAPAPSAPVPPTLHVAWRAPAGTPRSLEHVAGRCGNPAAADTLYLSFETGRDAPRLSGLLGTVYFRAQAPDSLTSDWTFEERDGQAALEVQFPAPGDAWGDVVPWQAPPLGAKKYDRTRASGRLQLVAAVAQQVAAPVRAGTRYAFARVIVPRGRFGAEGCARPVCVEWATASFSFEVDSTDVDASRTAGERFASWNSRDRRACVEHAGGRTPAAWQPRSRPR